MVTFTVNAQELSGSLGTYTHNNVGNKYTNLNWEVSYKFEKRTDGIYLKYYNPKVTVAQNALYATADKNYSKSELGLSSWPEVYSPSSLNVSVDCLLPNGKVELSGFACSTSNPYNLYESRICGTTLNGQEVSLSSFTLSVTRASYNPQAVKELDNIIKTKKSQSTNTKISQNTGSGNPLGKSETTTTEPISPIPSLESQYAKLGIPENTPTYSKKEVTNHLVTQAGNLGAELLNNWAANQKEREARLDMEYQAKISRESEERTRKYKAKFKEKYLPLIDKAKKGDENTRMTLYFASGSLLADEYVPQKYQWLTEAIKNNNANAILEEARIIHDASRSTNGYNCEKAIPYLEKAASLGSVDAMLILADWYDAKKEADYGDNKKYTNVGGEDAKKAFEFYNKAAENGSPNAMYKLGLIYRNGQALDNLIAGAYKILKKNHVEYDIQLDEKKAFEWFSKSYSQRYNEESLFSKSIEGLHRFNVSTFDDRDCFNELALSYKKGIGVIKDKKKAKLIELEMMNWNENTQKFKN